ncbi:transcriptional regulator [Aquabacterium olei]|uniref:Transcriptional regulator n=1 Tax=Aquabacterium olei TaxID=1296669 RepID=A0A2U8FNV2_9BURK|nr:helix-turn-helix domain-containing protein [Aquabacterium olei]AWI52693.1 transcriptional regulator [Aquabacterium olei]
MRRTSFADERCSIARALDLIGEWWTLLIVREAFLGCQRFGEFESRLGIAPNVLSQRLNRLVEGGVLQVAATSQSGKALAYRLTDKGRDLHPVIVALAQWGDRHAAAPDGPPIQLVERDTGVPIAPMAARSAKTDRPLRPRDVAVVAGPGATDSDLARLADLRAQEAAQGRPPPASPAGSAAAHRTPSRKPTRHP